MATDPLIGISNRWVLILASSIELGAVVFAMRSRDSRLAAIVCATLGAEFLTYRTMFILGGFSRGCPCLGTLGDWLPMSADAVNHALWFIAWWLFIGGLLASLIKVDVDSSVKQ